MSKQYGIKEVLNCTFFDYTTGTQLFYADYMSDATIETSAERLDLRGGQGNYKLLSFDHSKNMMFKAEMPLVDLNTIAMLTGKALAIGATNVPKREVLTADGSNTITLAATPVANTLKVYLVSNRDAGTEQTVGNPGTTQNTYSISGTVITLNSTTAPQGTTLVATYSYSAPSTTSKIDFTADKFAGYVRIVGEGIATDQITGALVPTVFEIKKAKAKNNFSITMKSVEASKVVLDFDLFSEDINGEKIYVTMNALT